jgi:putative addiction module CopG family antidote
MSFRGERMQISLPPEIEELVKKKLKNGEYRSADELVTEALRLLSKLDERKISSIRKDLALAIDQMDRGDYSDYDEHTIDQLFEEISAEGKNRLRTKRSDGV